MLPAVLACELFPSVRCAGVRMREGVVSRGAGAFPTYEGENVCRLGGEKEGLSRGKSWKVESENPCISRFFGSFFMVSLEKSWKIKIGCTMEVQDTDGREVCGWEIAAGR